MDILISGDILQSVSSMQVCSPMDFRNSGAILWQYMLLVPTVLHGEHTEKVCVLLTHLNESITLSITLEYRKENITLFQHVVAETELDQCLELKLPKMVSSEVGYVTIHGKGHTLEFHGKRSVLLQPSENLVFVQTDKPIYKPGQTVQFRVVALDDKFHPVNEKFPVIFIEDPQRNRVGQWRAVETAGGIIQLSFPLASEPLLGTYTVGVERAQVARLEHSFTVEEYVLPKFEVTVTVPKTMTILDKEMKVTACARYTYGKPVPGVLTVNICRKFHSSYGYRYNSCSRQESEAVCEDFSQTADAKGCFHEVVLTKIFQMRRSGYENTIKVTAKMVEKGTGVEITGEGSSDISSTIGRVRFLHVDPYFKKGLPVYGQVQLEDSTGAPLSNETVFIYMGQDITNYTTDQEGKAFFSIDTSSYGALSLQLRAFYKTSEYCGSSNWVMPSYSDDQRSVQYFYSKSKSYVKIQPIYDTLNPGHEEHVTVHYSLSSEGLENAEEVVFHYLMMAKGGIAEHGRQVIGVERAKHGVPGTFSLSLPISTKLAPVARMLILAVLPCGEVVADTTTFTIAKTFDNRVNLHFSAEEGLPGSQTNLLLEAAPGSLCAFRAVDKSVLLMKPEAELSVDSVYDLLKLKDLTGYSHGGHFLEEANPEPCVTADPVFLNGLYYTPSNLNDEGDAYDLMKLMGLKVFTNTRIRKPQLCGTYVLHSFPGGMLARTDMRGQGFAGIVEDAGSSVVETVRTYFPETWLWDLNTINSTGKAEVTLTVPDTITEWKAGMFCMAEDVGFGLSPSVSLTAFQPFFLELTNPYSIIRGEFFNLKATVSNYLPQCIRIAITLEESDDYSIISTSQKEDGYCVPSNDRVTISWAILLKSLGEVNFTVSAETLEGEGLCGNLVVTQPDVGRKDTIVKSILVEPEGIETEKTINSLACAKADGLISEISLKVPENVVEGSARAYFSVLGDIMGTAMRNLDKLLQMPFGCGEQNMALFAPNIYALKYGNETGQLTDEMKSKAISHLASGYQRQLIYKHNDGSYSAFGPPGQGNTWLTAFVLKCFAQAQLYTFIDQKNLEDALLWLSAHQRDNGCFQNVGRLFNNAMKGGVDDDVTLSAYVTIALLEYPLPITHPVVRNALFCLDTASKELENVYTKAMMAYAFTLAGKQEERAEMLKSLDEQAIKKDGSVHWHRHQDPEDEDPFPYFRNRPRAPSAEVEMTAYVLLARVSKSPVSQEDLDEATKIVKWVTKQQNPNGGFSSTQDTVVALHALSAYGTATYTKNGQSTVTMRCNPKFETQFQMDEGNRLLLQSTRLPYVPGEYSVEVQGDGCVYMQTTLRYNVPHVKEDAPFHLQVWTTPDTCNLKSQKKFDVHVNFSYTGRRPSSNMAILDVKVPSGYIPVKSTVKQLKDLEYVGRTEVHPNSAIIYLEHVSNATYSLSFSVEQDYEVTNLKPAIVRITDYYEPDEFAIEAYHTPCSEAPVEEITH